MIDSTKAGTVGMAGAGAGSLSYMTHPTATKATAKQRSENIPSYCFPP